MVIDSVFKHWPDMTGGHFGTVDIPAIMGITTVPPYYYIALVFCVVTVFILHRLDKSRYGRELYAIGNAEDLAEVNGINILRHRLFAFGIGACFAGLAGSIHASYYTYIAPGSFSLFSTIVILIWCVVGGPQKLWGPIIATVALTIIAEFLRMSGPLSGILYGAVLLIFIMAAPRGLTGLVDALRARLRKRESLDAGTK